MFTPTTSQIAAGAVTGGAMAAAPMSSVGSNVVLFGVPRGAPEDELTTAIESAVTMSMDLDKVEEGDDVLILPAINSGDPYPATVHPLAVSTLFKLLEGRGANVKAACMSGIEYVLQTPEGVKKGSSLECAAKAGILVPGVVFEACEERGWNNGFERFTHPNASHWPDGFRITKAVSEAKHVVLASRASTHGMAEETIGIKNLVGITSEDARLELHSRGPMNWFITFQRLAALGSGLKMKRSLHPDFFEKIAELGLAVHDKLLGSLIVGTKLQTTMGPNAYLLDEFGMRLFKSHVDEPETGLVISSSDMVAADAVALAFLTECYKHTPWWPRMWQKILIALNGQINELGTHGVYEDRVIKRAIEAGVGNAVASLEAYGVPAPLLKVLTDQTVRP